jgi:hypothetical protein
MNCVSNIRFESQKLVFNRDNKKVAVKRMDHIFEDMIDVKRVYREMHILRYLVSLLMYIFWLPYFTRTV